MSRIDVSRFVKTLDRKDSRSANAKRFVSNATTKSLFVQAEKIFAATGGKSNSGTVVSLNSGNSKIARCDTAGFGCDGPVCAS